MQLVDTAKQISLATSGPGGAAATSEIGLPLGLVIAILAVWAIRLLAPVFPAFVAEMRAAFGEEYLRLVRAPAGAEPGEPRAAESSLIPMPAGSPADGATALVERSNAG